MRQDAEDAVQEAFLKVWVSAHTYRVSEHSPISWLVVITRNQSIDLLRRRRMSLVGLDEVSAIATPDDDPEQALVRANLSSFVATRINALPNAYRDPLALRVIAGESGKVVAKMQNLPLNTVKSRLKRGLAMLTEDIRSTL